MIVIKTNQLFTNKLSFHFFRKQYITDYMKSNHWV